MVLQVEEKILKAGLRRQAHSDGRHPAEGAIGILHASVVYLRPEVVEMPPWRPRK